MPALRRQIVTHLLGHRLVCQERCQRSGTSRIFGLRGLLVYRRFQRLQRGGVRPHGCAEAALVCGPTLLWLKSQQASILEWLFHGIAREGLNYSRGNPPVTGPCSIDKRFQR